MPIRAPYPSVGQIACPAEAWQLQSHLAYQLPAFIRFAAEDALKVPGMRIRGLLRILRQRGVAVEVYGTALGSTQGSTSQTHSSQRWQTQPAFTDSLALQRNFGQAVGATHPWVRCSSSMPCAHAEHLRNATWRGRKQSAIHLSQTLIQFQCS